MNCPVKCFTSHRADGSEVPNAPSLYGQAGTGLAWLKACLVDGFNSITLDSVTITDGIGTATKANHGFQTDDVVALSWTGFSGERYVLSYTADTFTFDAAGLSSPSGTLTAKFAPAGWSMPFGMSGNIGVFQSLDSASPKRYFRCDDTSAEILSMFMYRTMTGLSSGTIQIPTINQQSSGIEIYKSSIADAVSRKWWLVADGRTVYMGIDFDSTNQYTPFMFGDIINYVVDDIYGTVICGSNNPTPTRTSEVNHVFFLGTPASSSYANFADGNWSYLSGSTVVSERILFVGGHRLQSIPSGNNGVTYPDPVFGGLETTNIQVIGSGKRGLLPGAYASTQYISTANVPHLTKTSIKDMLAIAMSISQYVGTASIGSMKSGCVFFTIKGPSNWSGWR